MMPENLRTITEISKILTNFSVRTAKRAYISTTTTTLAKT